MRDFRVLSGGYSLPLVLSALLMVLLGGLMSPGEGQTPSGVSATSPAAIRGKVVSAVTGGAIASAEVSLVEAQKGTYTDSAGNFLIRELPPGRDTLRVRVIGFSDQRVPVRLQPGRTTAATLQLGRQVLRVEDLSIEVSRRGRGVEKLSGFRRRQNKRNGLFIGPKEIEQKKASDAADLLRGEPGVSVGPSRTGRTSLRITRYRGDCNPFIWLDGVPAQGMHIDDISSEEVVALELYRGPSETPPQFEFRRGTCAALVVWTRSGRGRRR